MNMDTKTGRSPTEICGVPPEQQKKMDERANDAAERRGEFDKPDRAFCKS